MATTKKAASKTAPTKEATKAKPKEATKAKEAPKAKATPKAEAAPKTKAKGKEAKEPKAKAGKEEPKRKLGLRGAAPWAARHAAKHAAEARARAAEPPLPGSARATIRTPDGADDIKKRIAELHELTARIKLLKKNLAKNFFDVGLALREVQAKKLFEAKGFGTFEAYADRETEIGKHECMRMLKATSIFQREAAQEYGLEKVFAALAALEAEAPESRPSGKIPAPVSTSVLPLRPPGR